MQSISEDDLGALYESMMDVLTVECDSLALHKFYDGASQLDEQLWARAAELGWLGVGLPEDVGGLDMGVQGLDVLYRALGRSGAPGAFLGTLPAAQWLAEVARPELQREFLPPIVAGELELAAPIAPAGSSLALIDGRLRGASEPLLTSSKASVALVSAESRAIGAFALVRIADPGVRCEPFDLWDRTRRAMTIACDDVRPLAVIPDPSGEIARAYFRHFALAVAADSYGGGRRMTEQTVEYLKTRIQFGKPLASFQALKHRIANQMMALASAEELIKQAVIASAGREPSAGMWAGLAKAEASEAFQFVADDCVQLHGGVGFTWEFDCHIFLKRALLNEVLAGDNQLQRDRAADQLKAAALAGLSTAELAA